MRASTNKFGQLRLFTLVGGVGSDSIDTVTASVDELAHSAARYPEATVGTEWIDMPRNWDGEIGNMEITRVRWMEDGTLMDVMDVSRCVYITTLVSDLINRGEAFEVKTYNVCPEL